MKITDFMSAGFLENIIPLLPELYLTLATIVLLMYGVYRQQRVSVGLLAMGVIILGLTMLLLPVTVDVSVVVMNGMFIADGYTMFVKMLILGAAILSLLIGSDWLLAEGGRPFEFLVLVLFSVVGMMLMVSADSLLAVYLALELSSLALYVLAAFDRDNARATEAGLKYFVLGSLASGMMLFGMSLVYGFSGTLQFEELAGRLSVFADEAGGNIDLARVLVVGMVLMLIGFFFKLAAVPFHMWAPDVYEGAPTPVAAFFAVAPKIAIFALFTRVLLQPFADLIAQWQQIVVFVSLVSMLVGALAALRQTNMKRLLAYSSIGHAGFMLMGIASGSINGVQSTLIYLSIYMFMSIGAFACVLLMKRDGKYVENIADLSGLSRTHPAMAFMLAAFMFSMAGIPPLGGFFAKMYVIIPAIESSLTWLAVAGLLTSVISCYYYLRVVKFMYFDEPQEPLNTIMPHGVRIGLYVSFAVVMLFFLMPGPLVNSAKVAASVLLQ